MKQMPLLTLAAATLLLSSCSLFHQKAQEDTPAADTAAKPAKTTAAPTAEQQAAGRKAMAEEAALRAEEEALFNTPAAPADSTDAAESAPALSTGGLRMRRFAPPEEAVSAQEGTDTPLPNAAELHGLRSPVLRGGSLPMDINGKINPGDTQE